jgi:hypothetical protein
MDNKDKKVEELSVESRKAHDRLIKSLEPKDLEGKKVRQNEKIVDSKKLDEKVGYLFSGNTVKVVFDDFTIDDNNRLKSVRVKVTFRTYDGVLINRYADVDCT